MNKYPIITVVALLVLIGSFVSGCVQNDSSSTGEDSVVVAHQYEEGSIEISRYDDNVYGKSGGERMFEVRGPLDYIFDTILQKRFLEFRNRGTDNESYSIEIRVSEPQYLEDAKVKSLNLLGDEIGFTISEQPLTKEVQLLKVGDEEYFERTATAENEPGVVSGMSEGGGQWSITNYGLEPLAVKLSKELGIIVLDDTQMEGQYTFSVDFNNTQDKIFEYLESEYGLQLAAGTRELDYTVITFE